MRSANDLVVRTVIRTCLTWHRATCRPGIGLRTYLVSGPDDVQRVGEDGGHDGASDATESLHQGDGEGLRSAIADTPLEQTTIKHPPQSTVSVCVE